MFVLVSQLLIGAVDLCTAFLFLFGLKQMSSPATAPSGIRVAGLGMVAAVLVSFLYLFTVDAAARPHMLVNIGLAVTALVIGGGGAWLVGRRVAMTAMPQMVAIYNGMGGGAAGSIAAVELFGGRTQGTTHLVVTLLGGLIGAVSLSGSLIAWAKLDGIIKEPLRVKGQQFANAAVMLATLAVAGIIIASVSGHDALLLPTPTWILRSANASNLVVASSSYFCQRSVTWSISKITETPITSRVSRPTPIAADMVAPSWTIDNLLRERCVTYYSL